MRKKKKTTKKKIKKKPSKKKKEVIKKPKKPKIILKVKDVLPTSKAKLDVDDILQDAIKLFSRQRLTGAPVLKGTKIVGIVTITDITNFVDKKGISGIIEHDKKTKVSKLMTKNPITIGSEKTVTKAIEKMIKKKVSKLIVLDKKKKFLGVISRSDILSKIASILTKPERTPSSEIETDIDDFYLKLIEKRSATAKYFSEILDVDVDRVEAWAKALQDHGLIEIKYSQLGGMKLKIKKRSGK